MHKIHPYIAWHRLNVIPSSQPVRQKVQRFHQDRQRIIWSKVDKLLTDVFIREVEYPDWLANVVVVPKKSEKWQVCVDYTNLNDTYPKDCFLLPQIDQIVDPTWAWNVLLHRSFLRVPPNPHVPTRWGKDNLCNTTRVVVLQSYVVWA